MKTVVPLVLLCMYCCAFAQEDEEQPEYVSSCSLSIKTTIFPPDSADRSGNGYIEGVLCDKNGTPVSNTEITVNSTCGTLSCRLPGPYDDESSGFSDRSCFITGPDGRFQVYLVKIPFNVPGRVKAVSACGAIKVKAGSTFTITRHLKTHKKRRVQAP